MQKIILSFFIIFIGCASSEKITQLELRISKLEEQLDSASTFIAKLENSNADLSNQILLLKYIVTSTSSNIPINTNNSSESLNKLLDRKQCKAITKAGTQCKRMAEPGSDYCWQHQNYNSSKNKISAPGDRTIYTGPRGGKYYYNSKGKKVYIKKK